MQAERLFQAPMQEQTQQPTLPHSIRVMERKGGGEREKEGVRRRGDEGIEGGVRNTESPSVW